MSRPTKIVVEPTALLHNLKQIRHYAPNKKIIAMVKANAYGCGVKNVVPVLDGQVDALGVASIEEGLTIRKMGVKTPCMLLQGVFRPEEYAVAVANQFVCVLHHVEQLHWLLAMPLTKSLKVWVKVNTGMHRLGFKIHELSDIFSALQRCTWVDEQIGLLSHMACADQPDRIENAKQRDLFQNIHFPGIAERSMANSATIIAFPELHEDVVRPGIMLYGVSPFADKTANDLGLIPAMRFTSAISAIHHVSPYAQVGYGGIWQSEKPAIVGVVPVGYGDGYPRHIATNTPVWIKDREVSIIGRISMDMLTVDLTEHTDIILGDAVELWGTNIPVERIAKSAGTIGYELLCQITDRVR